MDAGRFGDCRTLIEDHSDTAALRINALKQAPSIRGSWKFSTVIATTAKWEHKEGVCMLRLHHIGNASVETRDDARAMHAACLGIDGPRKMLAAAVTITAARHGAGPSPSGSKKADYVYTPTRLIFLGTTALRSVRGHRWPRQANVTASL